MYKDVASRIKKELKSSLEFRKFAEFISILDTYTIGSLFNI